VDTGALLYVRLGKAKRTGLATVGKEDAAVRGEDRTVNRRKNMPLSGNYTKIYAKYDSELINVHVSYCKLFCVIVSIYGAENKNIVQIDMPIQTDGYARSDKASNE
jgi:hypothetical protein